MENYLKTLQAKLEKLQAKWEEITFGSEFKGEMKYQVKCTIEAEIYLTKQAIEKMKNGELCPKCGTTPLKGNGRDALSRFGDYHVCANCGIMEALEEAKNAGLI